MFRACNKKSFGEGRQQARGNRQEATGNSFTPIVGNFLDSKKYQMQGF